MFADAGLAGVLDALQVAEPFVVHGDPERLPSWLRESPLSSVEEFCKAYRGRILHGRRDGGPRFTLLDGGAAERLLEQGEALYLPDLAGAVPQAAPWLRELETSLGIPAGCARATAWVAPTGEGTALHLDAEDVISVQLAGTKHFEVAEPVAIKNASGYQYGPGIPPAADLYPQSATGFPDPATAHFTSIEMQPGSVLVLPRGHWHRTRCETPSMSVSIILAPPLLMDWALGVLRHRALENARWRAPLYGAPSQADKDAIAETFLRWAGEIPGVAGDVAWTPDTTLQWCPTRRVEWADPPRLVDVYNGRHDPLPADAPSAEVLRILAGRGAAFTLAEAQAEWGGAIESGLHALAAVGALYCWPVPRRGGT